MLYAVGANEEHGQKRSSADKRKAITTLLTDKEWSEWSNREIAKQCRVDEWTVRKYRNELSAGNPQIEKRKVERNGKVYEQNVSNIGKRERPAPEPPLPAVPPLRERTASSRRSRRGNVSTNRSCLT